MNYIDYNILETKNTKKRLFRQITNKDRIIIEGLISDSLKKGYTGPKITCEFLANKLGFSKSTISRELKRGAYTMLDGKGHYITRYYSDTSKARREKTSYRSHYKTKLKKGCFELKYIMGKLRLGADVITAMFCYEQEMGKPFPVCEKTLYNYFHKRIIKGIKPYRHYEKSIKQAKMAQKGKNISERPFESSDRSEFGHWEGDLIVGSRGISHECLLTLIERKTRFYYAVKIKDKQMSTVVKAFDALEYKLGYDNFKTLFKTITFDNGTEFRDYIGLETSRNKTSKRTDVYYANPYHSWERGSNERGNKMMRRFFPKGTNFKEISNKDIHEATCKINFTVRKKLNCETAMDQIKKLEDSVSSIFDKFKITNCFISN